MTPSSDVQEKLRRYLLGQLDERAREDIETNLLTDDDYFEELLNLEDEITDEYLAGKLNPADRSAFEHHFLVTPERHEDLNFARALNRHLAQAAPHRPDGKTWWPAFLSRQPLPVRATLLAAIVVVVAGAVWLLRNQRTPQSFATLTLTASQATRSEGTEAPKLKLPLRENGLKIVMVLPEAPAGATGYRTQIDTESGNTLSVDANRENNNSVSIMIPAAKLDAGRYSIKLFARGPDGVERRISGNYLFTLE